MHNFNRVIGFVSISFVLLFIAKINKTELYTAYFRTIADVEIRNSHALRGEGVVHAASAELVGDVAPDLSASPAQHAADAPELALPAANKSRHAVSLPSAPWVANPCIASISPRAPDAQA